MSQKIIIIGLLVFCNLIIVNAQNPCAGVFAGRVPHPDPTRCNEYYVCIFFISRLSQCGNNEIFDSDLRTCIPGNPLMCLITSSSTTTTNFETTTTTPDRVETTTELNLDQICEGVFFGARPHPSSSSIFIGCIRGSGTIMTCLSGEHFDANLLECTLIPEICEVPVNICEGIKLEIIINPCYCYRYIVCYGEVINAEGNCGTGEIFDVISRQCRPGNRQTCEALPEMTAPSTVSTTTTISSNVCDGILVGNRPMENNCTMYYRCINAIPQPQSCDPGMIFSRELLQCIVGDESDC